MRISLLLLCLLLAGCNSKGGTVPEVPDSVDVAVPQTGKKLDVPARPTLLTTNSDDPPEIMKVLQANSRALEGYIDELVKVIKTHNESLDDSVDESN